MVARENPTTGSAALRGAVTEADMVERVARAMAIADGNDPDDPAFMRYPGPVSRGVCWRDMYAVKARAAIAAMRVPTDAMIEAYCAKCSSLGFEAWANASTVLPAMIDAALGVPTGSAQVPEDPK